MSWERDCDECGAPAYAACAPACGTQRTAPASTKPAPPEEVRRFDQGASSAGGRGDADYIAFRQLHPRAWVVNRHGTTDEMVHCIGCVHFYDDNPATDKAPKLVATSREALARAEPRLPTIRRCSDCG